MLYIVFLFYAVKEKLKWSSEFPDYTMDGTLGRRGARKGNAF